MLTLIQNALIFLYFTNMTILGKTQKELMNYIYLMGGGQEHKGYLVCLCTGYRSCKNGNIKIGMININISNFVNWKAHAMLFMVDYG
jgi:hypothetical protein